MSADPRILKIIERLVTQTRKGEIDWERTGRGDASISSGTGTAVSIESADGDGTYPFIFRVLNSDGVAVTSDLIGSFEPGSGDAQELYQLANHVALRVDETLDALLEELDDDE